MRQTVEEERRAARRAYQRAWNERQHCREHLEYLARCFEPADAIPWGEHQGTAIKDLSSDYLRALLAGGLRHLQLYVLIRQVLDDRQAVL